MSTVIVRFLVGQDEEKSIVRLNQKLAANLDLIPPGASQPLVKPRSIDDVPILALTFWSKRYGDFELRPVAFDSIRVFVLRVSQGRSPFRADRQHIHHRLLEIGCTHLQTTLILIAANIFFIALSFSFQHLGIIWLMGVIVGLATIMSYMLVIYAKKKKKEEINAIIAGYFAMKTTKVRYRKVGIIEKQPGRIFAMNSLKKIRHVMN